MVNARDALSAGGKLTIETTGVDLGESYAARHPGVAPGAYVRLVVSDTGSGMDADTKARLFEPFFTTKEQGKGTGLGLSICHSIITQHGGSITVSSPPGSGAVFTILLPASRSHEISHDHKDQIPGPVADGVRIMVMDDEEMVSKIAREMLQGSGLFMLAADAFIEAGFNLDWFSNAAPKAPKGNSSKTKFTCDTCGQAAWGKPELNIDCGDCATPMYAED